MDVIFRIILFVWFVCKIARGDDFSAVYKYNNTYTCITNSSFPISWDTENSVDCSSASRFVPNFQRDIAIGLREPWMRKKSLHDKSGQLIYDRRWEEMRVYITGNYTNLFQTAVQQLRRNFLVPVSIRMKQRAHIFICDGTDVLDSDCYWFRLDKEANEMVVRSVSRNDSLSFGDSYRQSFNNNTKLNSQATWSHLEFMLLNNTFFLRDSADVMNAKFVATRPIIDATMIIYSENMTTFWKIHDFEYYQTEQPLTDVQLGPVMKPKNFFCVSMFIKTCQSCYFRLKIISLAESNKTIAEETYNSSRGWSEIQFRVEDIAVPEVVLVMSCNNATANGKKSFWAFDKLRYCTRKEFRIINSKVSRRCEILKMFGVSRYIKYKNELTLQDDCPENDKQQTGKFCIPCSWVYDGGCVSDTNFQLLLLIILPSVALGAGLILLLWLFLRHAVRAKSLQRPGVKELGVAYKTLAPSTMNQSVSTAKFINYVKTSLSDNKLHLECLNVLKSASKSEYEKIYDTLFLDYINMQYSNGDNVERAYVTISVPKNHQIFDFWNLVWKENVRNILLFDDINVATRKTVCIYWPGKDKKINISKIWVRLITRVNYADYEHRKLLLGYNDKTREIDHYRYIWWPNTDIPLSAINFVSFFLQVTQIPLNSTTPLLVHSRNGPVGMGFALLCDMTLRNSRTGTVDICTTFKALAEYPTPFVSSETRYYILAHLVIAECLYALDNPLDPLQHTKRDFCKYLDDSLWLDEIMNSLNLENNVYFKVVASATAKTMKLVPINPKNELVSCVDELSAVSVDGFRSPKRFLVTQQLTPENLSTLWQLIHKMDVSVVVALHENPSFSFHPHKFDPQMVISQDILVQFSEVKNLQGCHWTTIEMLVLGQPPKLVEIFSLQHWKTDSDLPENVQEFVKFCKKSKEVMKSSRPVLVISHNGVATASLFLATLDGMENYSLEKRCNVCTGARVIRRCHEQCLKKHELMNFLWESMETYLKDARHAEELEKRLRIKH